MLFCIGLFGVMTRRNTIGILLGIELMLNAVNINLVAFVFELLAVAPETLTHGGTGAGGRPGLVG